MTTFQFVGAGLGGFLVALPVILLLNPPTFIVNRFSEGKPEQNKPTK